MKKLLFLLFFAILGTLSPRAQQLAFPGAEGFGAYASGGRGGQVVHVTNLNASGVGSLADAVSKPGRFVVFDVGGVINITGKSITIASNVTIAGQTAPGEGITIYGGRVIASKAKNVIIRYIRMRGGKSINSSKCTLTLDECQNVILDHCSISWGPWDNIHIKDANNITWQNTIIAEGIEPQYFGSITDGTRNWTIHHCLWINNKSRNPKMKCYCEYYNNVVYNFQNGVVGGHSAADNYQDVINNYFIAGPNGSSKYYDQWTETDHLYSSGNYIDDNVDGYLNGRAITDHNGATVMWNRSVVSNGPRNIESASAAYYAIVDHCGASRVRDSHDRRAISQLTSLGRQGAFIGSEDAVGGIGILGGGLNPTDSDNDGMPDNWENANGLNPNADDANGYKFSNGYTNIENYVNTLCQKSSYLLYPMSVEATLTNATTARLTWSNAGTEGIVNVIVEQSEDGRNFTPIQTLWSGSTSTTVSGLIAKKIYYFRLKNVGNGIESLYSNVASVNDEYMRPGQGTAGGTTTFTPNSSKLYRIISYASVAYNSSANFSGVPKYLTFNTNGSLGSTTAFQWNDPDQLWEITTTNGGVYIRNHGTQTYISPASVSINGADRIGSTTTPSVFTINHTADVVASQSGTAQPIAFFRINSPSNSGQQIRAESFVDKWIWGGGTWDRADMVFTFVELDASLVRLYVGKLESALSTSMQLVQSATTDETLGYPSEALNTFMNVIVAAQAFYDNIDLNTTQQEEVNSWVTALTNAINDFRSTQIYTFTGFSTELAYSIFSYGTHPGASDANASASNPRRYLYSSKTQDGQRDSLYYRIGLTETQISAGNVDPLATDPAALWGFSQGADGYVYARNVATGAYLQIANTLSDRPVAIYPYYGKKDNGRKAFYMNSNDQRNWCFNVGEGQADNTGPVGFASGNADRVRLRWVILESTVEYESAIIGDVNNDGTVDSHDIGPLVDMILHRAPENLERGDINNDGHISLADVTALVTRVYSGN